MPSASRLAVSRQAIRRFLLDAQDLLGDHHYRPGAVATSGQVLRAIRRLEAVQLDPVAAVERNQHLVLAARVPGYTPVRLQQLLVQRRIFEYWGHAACVFPREADRALLMKYMRAYRIFDPRDWAFGWRRVPGLNRRAIVEKLIRAGTVIPLQIDGVRGSYYMLAEDEGRLRRHERRASQTQQITDAPIRFLAPLDNLLWRRERVRDFFDFHYTW